VLLTIQNICLKETNEKKKKLIALFSCPHPHIAAASEMAITEEVSLLATIAISDTNISFPISQTFLL
jgi:hypothetical protein